MTRLLMTLASSVGLILFVSFIASRLIRSRRRGLSVRLQVFLALALIVFAFAFGLGVLVVDRVEARAHRLALEAATGESRAVAAILEAEVQRTGSLFSTLAADLSRYHPSGRQGAGHLGLELLTLEGQVLFPNDGKSAATEPGAVFVDSDVHQGETPIGVVRVVKPTIVVEEMLADFAPTILAISLVLGAVAALAAAFIGRTIAEPIEALSTFSERVASGNPTRVPSRVAGREVARLVKSIDAMRRQLEGRPFVETFAADLSHELKNPVAAIRASAEVLIDGALDEPEKAKHFVHRILEAARRIERLTEELLSLAEVEARGTEGSAVLELREVLDETLRQLPPQPRIELILDGAPKIRGDRPWLGRALYNLLNNAQTHTDGKGPITVGLWTDGPEAVITVTNTGAIAKHAERLLFHRFVTTRGDKGGTGLGLSIVRAVAEAHSGGIELRRSGPPVVQFELRLPLA